MQSATPNPQTTTANLTKEFHKLLQDPLLHKSPSHLPTSTFSPTIPEAWQAQNPTSCSNLPHSSTQVSQKHIILSLLPPSPMVHGPEGVTVIPLSQDPSSRHPNRPTRPLCPLLSLSRPQILSLLAAYAHPSKQKTRCGQVNEQLSLTSAQ